MAIIECYAPHTHEIPAVAGKKIREPFNWEPSNWEPLIKPLQ